MKLLSTITEISVGNPPGTGKVGGELRLFFSTLNKADCHFPPPQPFYWTPNSPAIDTYTLTTGEVISLNLLLDTQIPGDLFVFGTIGVTLPGNIEFSRGPLGQSVSAYLPGKPCDTLQKGGTQGDLGGKHFDVGFELKVPWDGTSADCHGRWWAKWS